jgi:hypothetical protein
MELLLEMLRSLYLQTRNPSQSSLAVA